MFKIRKRTLLASLFLGSCVLWLAVSAAVVDRFTSRSREAFAEPPPKVDWGPLESLRVTTADGEEIGAWLVRGDAKKGCVLLLHGNGGSRREMLRVMQWLAESHYTALAISLRAHGDSTGQTNDIGWSASRDVIAAVDFLRQECPRQPIVVVGRSLGAAAAIFAAGELKDRVAGYFLEQPYKDLPSAVWYRLQRQLPMGLDWVAYLGMRTWAPAFLPVDPNRISPYERIQDIPEAVPIVVVSGTADRHAPFDDVKAMVERASSHAKLVAFDGAKHEALNKADRRLYYSALQGLLEEVNASGAQDAPEAH